MFTPIWGRWTHFDSYFSKGVESTNVVLVLRSFLSASSTETGASQFPKSLGCRYIFTHAYLSGRITVISRDVKSSLVRESLSAWNIMIYTDMYNDTISYCIILDIFIESIHPKKWNVPHPSIFHLPSERATERHPRVDIVSNQRLHRRTWDTSRFS